MLRYLPRQGGLRNLTIAQQSAVGFGALLMFGIIAAALLLHF